MRWFESSHPSHFMNIHQPGSLPRDPLTS
jgi:hypothetical protein